MNEPKICPICVARANNFVSYCIRKQCAWWTEWANDCSVPTIAVILADSEICRNIFPAPEPSKEEAKNFCGDCHWYEAEEQYCFRKGCHSYDESSCELWEPMPADEPIPAPGGKTAPTTHDLLYEEGGCTSNGV